MLGFLSVQQQGTLGQGHKRSSDEQGGLDGLVVRRVREGDVHLKAGQELQEDLGGPAVSVFDEDDTVSTAQEQDFIYLSRCCKNTCHDVYSMTK